MKIGEEKLSGSIKFNFTGEQKESSEAFILENSKHRNITVGFLSSEIILLVLTNKILECANNSKGRE